MRTTNYWTYKMFIESRSIYGDAVWRKVDIGLKGLTGNAVEFQLMKNDTYIYNYPVVSYCGMRSALGMLVGTGSTEPSIDDHALGSDVTSSFANLTCSYTTGADNASVKTVITLSGTNNTGSPITITEYGITKGIPSGNNATTPVLFIHELLPEPVVVKPGCQFTLPIEWVES